MQVKHSKGGDMALLNKAYSSDQLPQKSTK